MTGALVPTDDNYLTPRQVAAIFNVSTALLRDWRYRSTGPQYVRLNGLVRYPRSGLAVFVNPTT